MLLLLDAAAAVTHVAAGELKKRLLNNF